MSDYNTLGVSVLDWVKYVQKADPGNPMNPIRPSPDLHILAEGDSWFHMGGNKGFGAGRNLLDFISFGDKKAVIAGLALSGDTLTHMNTSIKYGSIKVALKHKKWNLILLSAGGNDLMDAIDSKSKYLVNGKPIAILRTNKSGIAPADFIDMAQLKLFLGHMKNCFEELITMRDDSINKNIPIVAHTYDYPTPNDAKAEYPFLKPRGPWLYKALKDKNILPKYWNGISDLLFSEFSTFLLSLSLPNLYISKTTGTLVRAKSGVNSNSNDWLNEIHPNEGGYKKIAKVVSAYIAVKKLV